MKCGVKNTPEFSHFNICVPGNSPICKCFIFYLFIFCVVFHLSIYFIYFFCADKNSMSIHNSPYIFLNTFPVLLYVTKLKKKII